MLLDPPSVPIGRFHNGACPAVERSNVVASNARFFRKLFANLTRVETERRSHKGRTALRLHSSTVLRVQLSARICDDQDKSNFVSATQARKSAPIFSLEVLLSPCLLRFFPTSFSLKTLLEVRIETERGIKDETPGCSFRFSSKPHREIHGSCRFDTRELVWPQ